MKTKKVKPKYVAWLSPENMHKASVKWLSELRFSKVEELFFDDLIKSYTLQLIDSRHFNKSKRVVDELGALQKRTNELIEIIELHEKNLEIMVDGKDEFEKEEAYKKEHGKLIVTVSKFFEKYRHLKTQLFTLITNIMKEGKQKRLLQKSN